MSLWVKFLSGFARATFKLNHSRAAQIAAMIALGLCVIAISLAKPGDDTPKKIIETSPSQITYTTLNQFVRVTGELDAQRARQTQMSLGPITLRGSRYLPMTEPGSPQILWVADENLPSDAASGKPITLLGQMVEGIGQQPPMYLQVGEPPNTRLFNILARVGMVIWALLILVILAMRWAAQRHFALSVSAPPVANTAAPELLWFGMVGRELPAQLSAIRREAVIENAGQTARWRVVIHRLMDARQTSIATSFGALAAARLTYQDDVGLTRRAVLAANSPATLNAALDVLKHVGAITSY